MWRDANFILMCDARGRHEWTLQQDSVAYRELPYFSISAFHQ